MSIDFSMEEVHEPLMTTSFTPEDDGEGSLRPKSLTEYIGQQIREQGYNVNVNHRDIALEQAHWAAKSEYQKGEP